MNHEVSFNIGCSGYYNRHWRTIFYPEKLPQSKWFRFYSEKFNSLELNTSFYKFPTAQSLGKWFKESPDDFLFSVKAPRIITHFKKFNGCEELLNDLYQACEQGLANKLACVLFQLPPGIEYSEETLHQIISSLKPEFRNVIEFRHKSWWTKKVYDKLKALNIIFCSVSHPNLPSTLIANTPTAYIRLHGTPQMFYSNYSNEDLIQIYQSILRKKNLKEAFVYFNNTAGNAGVLNALELKQMLREK